MVIESCFGLGEALVSGQITPDTYVVDKTNGTVIDANISEQHEMIVRDGDAGTVTKPVPTNKKGVQKMSPEKIDELAKVCILIEEHYKKPMDIEWAIEKNELFLTQARPITTL